MAEEKQPIINVTQLVKKFGSFRALDGFSITVNKGEVHGLLGPNGAGKTTAIRVMLGLIKTSSGKVEIFGENPWKKSVELHKRLAYVPGEVNFWPGLSGGEIIDLLGDLRGGLDESRRKELLHTFELDPKKKFRAYSKGNRQKVALVAALASNVELYVLDEPTSGLDPLMESVFQDEIRKLKSKGKTILLSSHILAEAEALCDTVTILRQGKCVESDPLEKIRSKHRNFMTVVSEDKLNDLGQVKGVYAITRKAGTTNFEVEVVAINDVLRYLSKHNIQSVISQPPSLEHLFLSHYKEEK